MPWAIDLQAYLYRSYVLPAGLNPISEDSILPPKWLLSIAKTRENGHAIKDESFIRLRAKSGQMQVHNRSVDSMTVVTEENKRVTPRDHWQDVRALVFTGEGPLEYGPGDVLTIYPQNSTENVDQLIESMQWDHIAEKLINFESKTESQHSHFMSRPPIDLPDASITFRQLLINHLDLTAIPRRSFFSLISHFTTDPVHKDRLLEFTKPDYIDELYDYTTRPRRSILEVLQEFESVKIPWQWAANVLPQLRGRQFSIASGGQLKSTSTGLVRFEILVAIVRYKTVIRKIREGVCTRYLASLRPGTRINVTIQKGGLGILREDSSRPAIMVGPGTGVAPMRSLIWERLRFLEDSKTRFVPGINGCVNGEDEIGKSMLIFGCRNRDADFFYNDEWEALKTRMPLDVHAAFSRDQAAKIYVQDVIRRHGSEVYRLVHGLGGSVYVCGSSGHMPKAVRAALADVFHTAGNMDSADAEGYVKQLEKEGRYKQETW